ncbi:MAG: hypothetical protein JNK99_10420 [Candidatus Accumulibacter sp.]|uniref:hypothetical protein n=1 Tax=Accumulibacter sp. TaxID=2053492 RepID=UPI001A51E28F|nr:hypothetical protein [Accumulibacter sp.]MBL8395145.1 hypothetical protein [Accumulibacter sp.]
MTGRNLNGTTLKRQVNGLLWRGTDCAARKAVAGWPVFVAACAPVSRSWIEGT